MVGKELAASEARVSSLLGFLGVCVVRVCVCVCVCVCVNISETLAMYVSAERKFQTPPPPRARGGGQRVKQLKSQVLLLQLAS